MFVTFLGIPDLDNDQGSADAFSVATAGIPGKVLAGMMGVHGSQVTRYRAQGHIPSDKLERLPDALQDAYHAAKLARRPVWDIAGRIARLLEAVTTRPAVLQASLEPAPSAARHVGAEERRRATA